VEIVNVDVADPPLDSVTLAGLSETLGPDGETVAVRFTTPENPGLAVTVMVTVPVEETGTFTDGLALNTYGIAVTAIVIE
jgi:hypothetical protein